MKTLILSFLFISLGTISFAQTKTEKIKVAGACGMCKKKIETAAKSAGATEAVWDVQSKMLTIKYNSSSSSLAKIEKAVAETGYDTPTQKATDEAYNKLHECCKYERTTTAEEKAGCCDNCTGDQCKDCCKEGHCTDAGEGKCTGCKDGKCDHQPSAAHGAKNCCKKA